MEDSDTICKNLPGVLSSFVDTFVDFSVSGFFLPPPHPPPRITHFDSPTTTPPSQQTSSISSDPQFRTRHPSPDRLIAIGDLHGDLYKFKQSLRLAGIIDSSDRWSGGSATVVQVGDVLDRGGDELKIFYFLEKLKRQAAKSGGSVVTMNGNHEIMNVDGDFRFATSAGLSEFSNWAFWYSAGNSMKNLCRGLINLTKDPFEGIPSEFKGIRKEFHEGFRARIAALRPNGPISKRFLSKNLTVVVMGESVFVHGGLLLNHASYGLERINQDVRDWINGERKILSRDIGRGRNGVVWSRKYSRGSETDCDCAMLEQVLATIPGAERMIMGHTIQKSGINGVCGNKAIRIDVGMSQGCINGLPEVLEISKSSGLRVLTSNPLYMENTTTASAETDKKVGLGLLLPEQRPKQVEVKA
ncbi:Synaptotagmin-like protein 2 [Dionaea muscipula]